MTLYRLSLDLMNVAPLLYFAAMTLAVLYWVRRGRSLFVMIPVVAGVALLLHTVALGLRWFEGGVYRPPWTNLYESLIYFSWGLALLTWVAELRFKVRYIGIFAYALVFAGLGLAYLTPAKDINPLVPALQSWWILAHSFLAAFAYSGLILASIFSFLYLVKKGIAERPLGLTASLLGLAAVVLAGGKDLFARGLYQLPEMVIVNGTWVKNVIPGTDPTEFYHLTLPYVPWLFWGALGLYAVSSLAYLVGKTRLALLSHGKKLLIGAVLVHGLSIDWIYYQVIIRVNLQFASAPYHLAFITILAAIQLLLIVILLKPQWMATKLPEALRLDRLAYQMTVFGFPFMTLILITGAIWAHEAWGRYWGWDPKETTALFTWLVYAAYIHARRSPGWAGRKAAVISVIGFFSVLFTYLGANLVLSGLHSYGAQ